jgi:triacylglycerol esterase/lipase EstA (alpha/beta hydrolase family)
LSISDNGSTFKCTITNCNGTYSVNSNNAVLSVNATTPSQITINNIIPNNNSFATPKELWKGNINQTASPIKICADASKATEIIFINNTGINSNNIRFLLTSDPPGSNSDLSGYFVTTDYNYNGNIIKAKFTHPKYLPPTHMPFRSDSIMIVDVTNPNNSIYKIPIQIYRAPVLFVHGIWSERTVFNEMETSLDNSGYYINSLTLSADYKHSSSKSFEFNSNVIPNYIIALFLTARANNFSTGKVDIICHSMGGILARQYIQSPPFQLREDIHKLITINTPHSGTQGANLILDTTTFEGKASAFAVKVYLSVSVNNGTISGGAVEDLKVDSDAIEALNTTNLNNGIVPSHSIISIKNPSFFGNVATSFISAYVFASIPVFSYSFSSFFDYLLFDDDNDYYVSVQSQKGGLSTSYTSTFDDVWHLATLKNNQVIAQITTLLNINSNNSNIFAQNGFSPVDLSLQTHYRPNYSPISVKEGSINITSPISGQKFNPGEVINISFNSSNGINRVYCFNGKDTNDKKMIV